MSRLTKSLDDWRERRRLQREFATITPGQIADVGLSREDVRRLALMRSEQVALMDEMARINGLDPAALDRSRVLQVATALTCAECTEQRRCREVLAGGAFREETDFCPNAETYRRLARG